MTDFDGSLLTIEGEDVPSLAHDLGELPGAVLVSGEDAAAGTVASATDPYPTRSLVTIESGQLAELLEAIQAWTTAAEALNAGGQVAARIQSLTVGERTTLSLVAGRPTVDIFMIPAGGEMALDLGDPALCPGWSVRILSADGAQPLTLMYTTGPVAASLGGFDAAFDAAVARGDLDFAADPFTVVIDNDGTPVSHTVDQDYPLTPEGLGELLSDMAASIGGTYEWTKHIGQPYVGTLYSNKFGASDTIAISSVTDSDPLDFLTLTPEQSWPGAVNAVDNAGGALDWDYPEYGVDDFRPPANGDGTHTYPNFRLALTRGISVTAIPAIHNGGRAKWTADIWPERLADFEWRDQVSAATSMDALRYRNGIDDGTYTAEWESVDGVLTPTFTEVP